MSDKCALCKKDIGRPSYTPMEEWKIGGNICSTCYSEQINRHYPGKHIRTNRLEDFE